MISNIIHPHPCTLSTLSTLSQPQASLALIIHHAPHDEHIKVKSDELCCVLISFYWMV